MDPEHASAGASAKTYDYLLPSGDFVSLAGHHPTQQVTTAAGIVTATRAPISRAEVETLLEHACRPGLERQDLRYMAYAALGAGSTRAGFEPLTPWERKRAVQGCADALQLMRATGLQIGAAS